MPSRDGALEAILKSPELRTDDDLQSAYAYLSDKSAFPGLASFDNYVIRELVKCMTCENFDADTVVVNCGDMGDCFYLLFEGELVILNSEGNRVAELQHGGSFGEMALINNSARNATVRTKVPSLMIVVTQHDYHRLLSGGHMRDLKEKIVFLQSLPMFSEWSADDLEQIAKYFEVQTRHPDEILVSNGDVVRDAFFLLSGKCTYSIPSTEHKDNVFVARPKNSVSKNSVTKVSKPDNYEQADEVGYLGAGSFFGHRDIIEDRRSTATVITLSKCRFLVVSKLNFFAMTQDDSAATMAEDDHAKHDVVKSLSHFHEDDLRESLKRIGKMLTKDNFVTEPSAGSRALSEYMLAVHINLDKLKDVLAEQCQRYPLESIAHIMLSCGTIDCIMDVVTQGLDDKITQVGLELIGILCQSSEIRRSKMGNDGLLAVIVQLMTGKLHKEETVIEQRSKGSSVVQRGTAAGKSSEPDVGSDRTESIVSRCCSILSVCAFAHNCRTIIRSSGAFEFLVSIVNIEGKVMELINRKAKRTDKRDRSLDDSGDASTFLTRTDVHETSASRKEEANRADEWWDIKDAPYLKPFKRGAYASDMVKSSIDCIIAMCGNERVCLMLSEEQMMPVLVQLLADRRDERKLLREAALELISKCAQHDRCRRELAATDLCKHILDEITATPTSGADASAGKEGSGTDMPGDIKIASADVKLLCAEALHNLAHDSSFRQQVQSFGGMQALLSLLTMPGMSPRLLTMVSQALSQCAVNPESTASLCESGAVGTLLNLLPGSSHAYGDGDAGDDDTNYNYRVSCVTTLRNMFVNSKAARMKCLDVGGERTLLSLLKGVDTDLLCETADALHALSVDTDAKGKILLAGNSKNGLGGLAAVWTLISHENSSVVQFGAKAMASCMDCELGRQRVYDGFVQQLPQVTQLLNSDPPYPELCQGYACAVISSCVKHEALRVIMAQQAVMPALMRLSHSKINVVREHCCMAIRNMCDSKLNAATASVNRTTFHDLYIADCTDNAQPESGDVAERIMHYGSLYKAAGFLTTIWRKRWFVLDGSSRPAKLSYYDSRADVGVNPPKGVFMLDAFSVELVGRAEQNKEFCFKLVPNDEHRGSLFVHASSESDCQGWMSALERLLHGHSEQGRDPTLAMMPLVVLLKDENDSGCAVQKSVALAMEALSEHPANGILLRDAGAVDTLMSLVSSRDRTLSEAAAGALHNIIKASKAGSAVLPKVSSPQSSVSEPLEMRTSRRRRANRLANKEPQFRTESRVDHFSLPPI